MKMKTLIALGATGLLSACVADDTTPQYQTAPVVQTQGDGSDLADFVGAKAGQAENGLQLRGYSLVRTEGLTAFWYNASNSTCARIVTSQGKYVSVTAQPLSVCGY
jgi:hypothetical protein